jgi:serine protease Do
MFSGGGHPCLAVDGASPSSSEQAHGAHTGYLGVGVANLGEEDVRQLNLDDGGAVVVTWVGDDCPAAKAGLQPGDVLLRFNNDRIQSAEQLGQLVRETPAGRKVRLVVFRDGKTQTLNVMVGSRRQPLKVTPEETPATPAPPIHVMPPDWPDPALSWHSAVLGIECEGIRSQFAEYFGVKQGVLVRYVAENSAAEKAGLKAGDVLTKVGDKAVTTPRDVTLALRAEQNTGKQVRLRLMRDRKEISINVSPQAASLPTIPWTHSIGVPDR